MSFTSTPANAEATLDGSHAATIARVDAVFRESGLNGHLHVLDIDSGAGIAVRGDEVCECASTGKVPILVALMRAVATGALSLDEQIDVPVGDRTDGATGLSSMSHPARLALGDIAHLMIAISDNHATDLVLERVPPSQVTAAMRELGLTVTTLDMTIREFFARLEALAEVDQWPEVSAWRTTAAEMCRLLQAIWQDEAAPPQLCEQMRMMLRCCVTSNGLTAELPLAVQTSSGRKTGTLVAIDRQTGAGMIMRNEVGVVEYPDGRRYAVAVFTREDGADLATRVSTSTRAIGAAVRVALDGLRL
ncbi:MAG TPA: serine hydrolase [Candidatus Limnocylindrales bacterium]|nr:serine hydrolase [Candidatus Limnocylindrales bacterium]